MYNIVQGRDTIKNFIDRVRKENLVLKALNIPQTEDQLKAIIKEGFRNNFLRFLTNAIDNLSFTEWCKKLIEFEQSSVEQKLTSTISANETSFSLITNTLH